MHLNRPSWSVLAGLGVLWAAAGLSAVALLERIHGPKQLPFSTSGVPRFAEESLLDSILALDLSPVGRGAYLLDGFTLVGVGLDSSGAEQGRRAAARAGFQWIPRGISGVHVYDPTNRLELRLRRDEFPQSYVLLAPGRMPMKRAGRLDARTLSEQLAAYRTSWMGRPTPP